MDQMLAVEFVTGADALVVHEGCLDGRDGGYSRLFHCIQNVEHPFSNKSCSRTCANFTLGVYSVCYTLGCTGACGRNSTVVTSDDSGFPQILLRLVRI